MVFVEVVDFDYPLQVKHNTLGFGGQCVKLSQLKLGGAAGSI